MSARRAARRAAVVFSLLTLLLLTTGQAAAQTRAEAPVVPAEAMILVDASTGAVIAADDAGERRPIASATKLMTALLALERARPGEVFRAAGYEPAPIESQIGLRDGERMAVRDLLVALLLESANDAAVTLAEGIEGSTSAFVAEMNERARALGLADTSFANPIGFDDPANYSTARDLARLARLLMEKRRFRDIVEEPQLRLETGAAPRVVDNRNDLVGSVPHVDGIKTGHTPGAGYVMVGTAADGAARVISVVLGAPSEAARERGTRRLLAHGLDRFVERRVVQPRRPVAHVAVAGLEGEEVGLLPLRGVSLTVLRDEPVATRVNAPAELEGPLPAGERVGAVRIARRGEVVERVPLVTARAVEAPGLLTVVTTTLEDHLAVVVALAAVPVLAVAVAVVLVRRRRARAGTGSAA